MFQNNSAQGTIIFILECFIFVFGVHTENGSCSKRTVDKFMRFHLRFRRAPFSQRSNVDAR